MLLKNLGGMRAIKNFREAETIVIDTLWQESNIASFMKWHWVQLQGDLPHPLQLEDE